MLASDFQFFRKEIAEPDLRLELYESDPPYEEAPRYPATVYTPRNIAVSNGHRTFVDYSGRAMAIWDRTARVYRIYSKNIELQYEATYLFLLSQIGEMLDGRGVHRIHGLALGYNGRAVVAVLPMGGGKSTLGSHLLRYPEFDFLSDDSPFLTADGCVNAFPLRLGLLPGGEKSIPPEFCRTIDRMEFGPKVLVDYRYYAHRIKPAADPGIVFLGRRSLDTDCRIEPASTSEWHRSMIVNCVVGLGLYQGLEFVMRSKPSELIGKAGVAWSRLRNARALCRKSEVYHLVLGRDHERNAATVVEFVKKRLAK